MSEQQQEREVLREWSFNVNLSDVQGPTRAPGTVREVPTGFYQGLIKDCYINPEKQERVVFKIEFTEPGFEGVIRTDGINIPRAADDKVRYYWRAVAESCGYTPTQLDSGEIVLGPDAFIGKPVYFHYNQGVLVENKRRDERISYMSQAVWNTSKAQAGGNKATTPAAANGAARLGATPPVNASAAATPSKAEMLSKLGL
jgi:hypothetical protein